MEHKLYEGSTIPETQIVIEHGGRRYNVLAETQGEYVTAEAFPYADGLVHVHFQYVSKSECARIAKLEAPRTCATCFHYTANAYGKNFCTNLDSNVYDIAKPDKFSCSEFCLPRLPAPLAFVFADGRDDPPAKYAAVRAVLYKAP